MGWSKGCVLAAGVLAACGRVGFEVEDVGDASVGADTAAPDGGSACAAGFAPLGGAPHRYLFKTVPLDWASARALCESFGAGHGLALPTEEFERIALRNQTFSLAPGRWWLGAHDEGMEGLWTDVLGAPLVYEAWAQNEPNNSNNNEDCLDLIADPAEGGMRHGFFDDRDCAAPYAYVCACVLP